MFIEGPKRGRMVVCAAVFQPINLSESYSCPFHLKVYIDYVTSLSTASIGMPDWEFIPIDVVKIPNLVSGVKLNFE